LPIGHARFRNAFRTTIIGFTATYVLPGRVGEVLRPYLLARAEGFSASSAFATVVIERVLDLIAVLLLFVVFLMGRSVAVGPDVMWGGAAAAGVALGGLAALGVGARYPAALAAWAGRLAARLPGRLADIAGTTVRTFVDGLAVMRRPAVLLGAFGLSILLWVSIALGVWLTSRAFDLTFRFDGSFLIIMFLMVGVAAPTPAGVGTFHWMYRLAVTTFFGAPVDTAVAAAIVLHAVSFIPVSLLGFVFLAQDGLTFGRLRRLTPAAAAAETAPVGGMPIPPVDGGLA
ncbi:MAG TPA: lysylphosphatidylglycerol synthase transmembrane domain-containing protein, partial [Vicinamibacterales bacterium]